MSLLSAGSFWPYGSQRACRGESEYPLRSFWKHLVLRIMTMLLMFPLLIAGSSWLSWTSRFSCKWKNFSLKQYAWKFTLCITVRTLPILSLMSLISQGPASEGPAVCVCTLMFIFYSETSLKCLYMAYQWKCCFISCCVRVCLTGTTRKTRNPRRWRKHRAWGQCQVWGEKQSFLIWIDFDAHPYKNIQ